MDAKIIYFIRARKGVLYIRSAMKIAKWIGVILGWILIHNFWGIFLGFIIGSLIDEGQVRVYSGSSGSSPFGNINDFTTSLLYLSAAVMNADGSAMKSELDFVRRFFTQQFGEAKANADMLLLREILQKEIPVQEVCSRIKNFMPFASRLQLIHYLFGLSNADGHLHPAEISVIEQIAYYLGINSADMNSIKAMYWRDAESDYKILEIEKNSTEAEIKKAYRKMANKFHPDKVASEGEEVQRAATEKFKKVQEAYENIKKQRGIN
ncbi:MAG: TerB family tellurite resistance protein [Bacteroidetes bacterium]|nr:TerB family tellurite resistance protein [Bacteroidota bacterium]